MAEKKQAEVSEKNCVRQGVDPFEEKTKRRQGVFYRRESGVLDVSRSNGQLNGETKRNAQLRDIQDNQHGVEMC